MMTYSTKSNSDRLLTANAGPWQGMQEHRFVVSGFGERTLAS